MPPKKKIEKRDTEEALTRIAIVSSERCKPKKCRQECKKSCPVVKQGKLCIEVGSKSKIAFISEPLCIGAYRCEHAKVQIEMFVMSPTKLTYQLHATHVYIIVSHLFALNRLFVRMLASICSFSTCRLWYLCQEMSLRSD
jgi:translation initiation factor RLI1